MSDLRMGELGEMWRGCTAPRYASDKTAPWAEPPTMTPEERKATIRCAWRSYERRREEAREREFYNRNPDGREGRALVSVTEYITRGGRMASRAKAGESW